MLHNLSCGSDLGSDVLDGPVRDGVREAVYLPVQPNLLVRYVISRPNLGSHHECAHVDEQRPRQATCELLLNFRVGISQLPLEVVEVFLYLCHSRLLLC